MRPSPVNENIRILRNRMGLTQEKFAELLGITRKALGSYEESRAVPPLDKLSRIATLFGVSLDELSLHRFSEDDTPLFSRAEEVPEEPVIAPVVPQEKKRPFSRTGQPVFEPVWESAVRYISHKYFDKYLVDSDFQSRLDELPALGFPFREEGRTYRAFDMPADSYLPDGIVTGELLTDHGLLTGKGRFLVVSPRKGIFFRKLENAPNGEIIIKNEGGSDFTLLPRDIREIWRPVGYFSRTLPTAQPDLAGLSAKFNALKSQFEALL